LLIRKGILRIFLFTPRPIFLKIKVKKLYLLGPQIFIILPFTVELSGTTDWKEKKMRRLLRSLQRNLMTSIITIQ